MRCQQMRQLGFKKKKAFYKRFLSKNIKVLIEEFREPESGNLKGKTSNYIDVTVEGPDALKNQLVIVKLVELNENQTVLGTISSNIQSY